MNWQFSYSGKIVDIIEVRGVVLDAKIWTETRVTGENFGGGGRLTDGTGYISAPKTYISSEVTERGRAFVKCDDGRERDSTGLSLSLYGPA